MNFLVIAALLGLVPAFIAQSKGRSFGAWWLYGFLLFIIAVIHALCISKSDDATEELLIKCPFCAEHIKQEAIKCKYCGSHIKRERRIEEFSIKDIVINDEREINNEVVREIALRMHEKMPNHTTLSTIITHSHAIDEIKNDMPKVLSEKFQTMLEMELDKAKATP